MSEGIVLGCSDGRQTAKMLASFLTWPYAETFYGPSEDLKIVFRYGNSRKFSVPGNDNGLDAFAASSGIIVLNKSKSIKASANKIDARKLMRRLDVAVPETIDLSEINYEPSDIREYFAANSPWIIRPRFHSKGRDFFVVDTLDQFKQYMGGDFYASSAIVKRTEYRVFVLFGKVMEVNEKVKMSPRADEMIRNHRKGWGFRWIPYEEANRSITGMAIKAVHTFGLDFGAVDLCIDEHGNVKVFEVNSAPGMVARKCMKLAEKIKAFLSSR